MGESRSVDELVSRAYRLGFEIGFFGHFESLGWIRREKQYLDSRAKQMSATAAVATAYRRGKRRGEEARRSKLSRSSAERLEPKEEEPIDPDQYLTGKKRSAPSPALSRPRVISSPSLVEMEQLLMMPGMLKNRVSKSL